MQIPSTPWKPEDGPLRLMLTDGHGTVIGEWQVTTGAFTKMDPDTAAWDLTKQTQQLDMCMDIRDHVQAVERPV
jgi:hypothetical protein